METSQEPRPHRKVKSGTLRELGLKGSKGPPDRYTDLRDKSKKCVYIFTLVLSSNNKNGSLTKIGSYSFTFYEDLRVYE